MILVLGGTTEGRLAVKVLDESGKPYFYSTRGDSQQVSCRHGERVSGGMDAEKMEAFCRAHSVRLLVDAAHPFAVRLHETVEQVSRRLQLPVVRFERIYPPRTDEVIWCADYQEAVRRLKEDGITRLLALTGVQTIGKLRDFWADDTLQPTCWFRILAREESVSLAVRQGFDANRLVFYHEGAPETELLEQLKPQAILTKESGRNSGLCGLSPFPAGRFHYGDGHTRTAESRRALAARFLSLAERLHHRSLCHGCGQGGPDSLADG